MAEPSIFSRIINGEVPAYKIYEDDRTLAFLDIYPTQPGHVLVVPKNPTEFIWDLSPEKYQTLMDTVYKIGRHMREVLDVPHVGVKVLGTDVPHAHVHLIPFTKGHEFHKEVDQAGQPDHQALADMAKKLAF